jgi:ABC-2 type transport system permease protein
MSIVSAGRVTPGVRSGHYGFANVARMEWIKLSGLRSTWWSLAIALTSAVVIGVASGLNIKGGSGDPTNVLLAGTAVGLLITGVIGALAMTGEYSSGLIRSTLTAAPRRGVLLGAKAAVFGAVALLVGEAVAFVSFFAGSAALPDAVPTPSITDPAVLRAVVMSGAAYCLIGLIGMGLGTVARHTAAAIGVLVGGVYVVSQLVGAVVPALRGYVPIEIVADSLSAVHRPGYALNPWAALAVLALYASVAMGAGAWRLIRQDV